MGNKFRVDIYMEDLLEARRTFDAMGQLPARIVTAAARRGATVVKRAAKNHSAVPVRTGRLRRGIKVSKIEKSKLRGKKVYDIWFDPEMNDEFQRKDRPIKRRGLLGGKSDHGYYPASMEYGYLAHDGYGGVVFRPGRHFLAKAGEEQREPVKKEMAKKFNEAIQKEWVKRHGS